MTEHQILIVVVSILVALTILVIEPLRKMFLWVITMLAKPLINTVKITLHILGRSHRNVLRNFLPRQQVIYELSDRRTTHDD